MLRIFLAFTLWFTLSGFASAYCSDPGQPPENPISSKPSQPRCLSQAGKYCADSKVRYYRDSIERYEEKMDDFHKDLQTYYQNAMAFSRCELREAREIIQHLNQ